MNFSPKYNGVFIRHPAYYNRAIPDKDAGKTLHYPHFDLRFTTEQINLAANAWDSAAEKTNSATEYKNSAAENKNFTTENSNFAH